MKDAVHHLRHVQKKVIQSVRRSENAETPQQKSTSLASAASQALESPDTSRRKRHLFNQLPQAARYT